MVLGILWIYWVGSILALVFGYIARRQIDQSQGTQSGRGMAIAGIVLGWIGIGMLIVVGVLVAVAATRSNSVGTTNTFGAPPTSFSDTITTTAVNENTTTNQAVKQEITVTPDANLQDGQTVYVSGTGFTPGKSNLGINECADQGSATGAGDCNLGALKPVSADAQGAVSGDFVVKKGPFGTNNIVCSATQKCLISIGEITPNPTEEADTDISFAD